MKSHGKGSSFEREICKKLSLWWTDGENDSVFWRTSNSGGRATIRSKAGKATKGQEGDIAAIDRIGEPFIKALTVEIKRGYSSYSVADMFDYRSTAAEQQYEQWIKQVSTARESSGSCSWMLITKRNQRDTIVFVPTTLMVWLKGVIGPLRLHFLSESNLGLTVRNGPDPERQYWYEVSVYRLDDWLDNVKRPYIERLVNSGDILL
jgi:hypothetical protein